MSVYVDDYRAQYGRMIMCHMLADDVDELHAMADRLGIARRHFQSDHYDICLKNRMRAIRFGAVPITRREAVRVRRRNGWRRIGRTIGDALGFQDIGHSA